MVNNRMKLICYIAQIQHSPHLELLVNPKTGELWKVSIKDLKDKGIPQGWDIYDRVSKETLLFYLQDLKWYSTCKRG